MKIWKLKNPPLGQELILKTDCNKLVSKLTSKHGFITSVAVALSLSSLFSSWFWHNWNHFTPFVLAVCRITAAGVSEVTSLTVGFWSNCNCLAEIVYFALYSFLVVEQYVARFVVSYSQSIVAVDCFVRACEMQINDNYIYNFLQTAHLCTNSLFPLFSCFRWT